MNVPSQSFPRSEGVLTCQGVSLEQVLARAGVQTPAYVYDLDGIAAAARSLSSEIGTTGLCAYAVKANGAGPIVRTILAEGCGIDVVSGGELRAVLRCGARPDSVVYSGVAKKDDELDLAIASGIRAIHAESIEELERIAVRVQVLGRKAVSVGIRLNPGVRADTHANVATGHDEAKFGVPREDLPVALSVIKERGDQLNLVGLAIHVGSALKTKTAYVDGARVLAEVAKAACAQGFGLRYLDTGGGFGVPMQAGDNPPPPMELVGSAREVFAEHGLSHLEHVIEPGRVLVAPYGVLVTTVVQAKRSRASQTERRWLLVDAGMNDLMRPALYQAFHRIEPLTLKADAKATTFRVAGPVCESSDDFGEHVLCEPVPKVVVIRDAGAYGRSMASGYNARALPAEVFMRGGEVVAVRRAKSMDEVVSEELGVG